jgi:hypothetical protein
MRRFIFLTGAVVLGLATLMWAAAPARAPRPSHAPARVAPPARAGSVHYGARPAAPARVVGPAVWAGAVRSEHYAHAASRGAYRNPYRDEYFRRFRPGYSSFLIGDASYYYYDDLPPECETVVSDGHLLPLRRRVLPGLSLRGTNGVYGGPYAMTSG